MDVVCHFFDTHGHVVPAWEERAVAVSLDQLRAADVRVGVAAGRTKGAAVLAALRSGVINTLVVDAACARAVVDMVRRVDNRPNH